MVLTCICLLSLLRGASFLCWVRTLEAAVRARLGNCSDKSCVLMSNSSLTATPRGHTTSNSSPQSPRPGLVVHLNVSWWTPSWMWQTLPILKINSAFSHGLIRHWRKINCNCCATVWLTVNSFGPQYDINKHTMDSSVTGFGLFMGFVFNKIIVNFGQSYLSVKAVDIYCHLFIIFYMGSLWDCINSFLLSRPPWCLRQELHHFALRKTLWVPQ